MDKQTPYTAGQLAEVYEQKARDCKLQGLPTIDFWFLAGLCRLVDDDLNIASLVERYYDGEFRSSRKGAILEKLIVAHENLDIEAVNEVIEEPDPHSCTEKVNLLFSLRLKIQNKRNGGLKSSEKKGEQSLLKSSEKKGEQSLLISEGPDGGLKSSEKAEQSLLISDGELKSSEKAEQSLLISEGPDGGLKSSEKNVEHHLQSSNIVPFTTKKAQEEAEDFMFEEIKKNKPAKYHRAKYFDSCPYCGIRSPSDARYDSHVSSCSSVQLGYVREIHYCKVPGCGFSGNIEDFASHAKKHNKVRSCLTMENDGDIFESDDNFNCNCRCCTIRQLWG